MKQRLTIAPASSRDSEWLWDWCLKHASEAGVRGAERRFMALSRCIDDGCVQVARGLGRVLGVAALDLDRGAISEFAFTGSRPDIGLVRGLLGETERLAVQFGMESVTLTVSARHSDRFLGLGYRIVSQAGATAHVSLHRSLARRQTRYSRRVREILAGLGIPSDYARRHRIPLQPEAKRLAPIGTDVFGRDQRLAPGAARAWRGLVAAAARQGVMLQAVSAFRTVDYQRALLERKLRQGQDMARILRVSAAPGYSEHHTGNAIDITTPGAEPLEEPFARTDAFAWLRDHAQTHGFRLSFPKNNRHGVAWEPWHWYYRG